MISDLPNVITHLRSDPFLVENLDFTLWFLQVHAYIISSLKKEMPSVFGKENKKKELINSLGEIYSRIEREHQISPGDFPNLKKMQVNFQSVFTQIYKKHWYNPYYRARNYNVPAIK